MLRAVFILFCLLSIPLRANLGETVEQCVARYGKPIGFSEANAKTPFGTVVFTAGPYTLVVFLVQVKEVGAKVTKTDKSAFSEAEMQTIMNADSTPGAWIPTTSIDETCLSWTRADKATVLYDKTRHILMFTSPEMGAALNAKPAAAAPAPAPSAGTGK